MVVEVVYTSMLIGNKVSESLIHHCLDEKYKEKHFVEYDYYDPDL